MLYNPQWKDPDPFSLTNLIAWLRTKDPKEWYSYANAADCLIGQWVKSMDMFARPVDGFDSSFWYSVNGQHVDLIRYAPIAGAGTFGAALIAAENKLVLDNRYKALKAQQKEKENVA